MAGGAFNYVSVTFGELAAWSVAWNMILETTLSSSAVARGFSGYLATLIGLPPASLLVDAGPVHLDFAVLVLIGALTLVLCRGVAASAKFNIGEKSVILSAFFLLLIRKVQAVSIRLLSCL